MRPTRPPTGHDPSQTEACLPACRHAQAGQFRSSQPGSALTTPHTWCIKVCSCPIACLPRSPASLAATPRALMSVGGVLGSGCSSRPWSCTAIGVYITTPMLRYGNSARDANTPAPFPRPLLHRGRLQVRTARNGYAYYPAERLTITP